MDAGAIANFKSKYRGLYLNHLVEQFDKTGNLLKINVKDALGFVLKAWDSVEEPTSYQSFTINMGIKGLYAHLSKLELPPEEIDVHELAAELTAIPGSAFELDLFGTFFYEIHSMMLKKFNAQTSFAVCGHAMVNILQKIFGPHSSVTVHIDGDRCQEKARAYSERDNKRGAADNRLVTLLDDMRIKSSQGKWSSRSRIKDIKKNLRQLFTFSAADKTAFAAPFAGS
ncbi:hypothetical protein BGZ46_005435, partial [Entomortierella lignicola]